MSLYPYQERVDALLRQGRSVILQAPTGAGKTRAALSPFLAGWHSDPAAFPRQCIYAVPLRVLANQFNEEYRQVVAQSPDLREALKVSVQTGTRPADRRFERDLIFTTIDQVLSSFLTIPYSLSNRQANLNAGAIIGSYLVFDEFHLFPVDETGSGALATTVQMLRMLKEITPFVLMTATFSSAMLPQLCHWLGAEQVTLSTDEVAALPSQLGKQRRYRYTARELTADAVTTDFAGDGRRRAIAVCNTVARAQRLAANLRDDPRLADVRIELLHSRFYASDREGKETAVRREFGEDRQRYEWGPTILVATQVIEVGLNLTCEVLHTELAPAAAIVQRAGRCARFTGESGTVLIYDVPLTEDGQPDYAPYGHGHPAHEGDELDAEGGVQICKRTQAAVAKLHAEEQVLSYHDELDLVNAAHQESDQRLLDTLHTNQHRLRDEVARTLRDRERSAARELIRDIDNRTVIVHDNPTWETLPNPYRYEGIGLRRNTLLGWYSGIQATAEELALDWVVQLAVTQESSAEVGAEGAEQRRRVETHWQALPPSTQAADIRAACRDIASSGLVVVNPALVAYDTNLGFRFEIGAPASKSPESKQRDQTETQYGPLRRETYAEHIAGLQRMYVSGLRDRTAAVRRRMEERHRLAPGTLDRAIRLMFAVHDLGKLHIEWQEWAHRWQERVNRLRRVDQPIAPDYMAAHTDYNGDDRRERLASREITPPRPPHAAESARAAKPLLTALADDCETLYVGLMTAVICHHSANLDRRGHGPWQPHAAAKKAFNEAMRRVDLIDDAALLTALRTSGGRIEWQRGFPAAESLSEDIVREDRPSEMLFYLFLVRILRLADQGSQERAG